MKAFTLIELILVVMILGVVVMTAANFELFGRFEVNDIDRASRLQNDVYFISASLCKDLNSALGSSGEWPLAINTSGGNTSLVTIWVDYNKNGVRDGSDRQVAYGYDSTTHQLRKYDNYSGSPGTYTILSRKVVSFVCTVPASVNYMNFSIAARYDPASGVSTNNPEVSMFSSGNMPSVSLN
ncbi:MAG: prepilin-type N-terminal cleavage/methylation domain-containing protein [Candidatus Omnitrophota bacterium]|jgi:prepilin-type N-terminal cleavage/methylation domain-containing protein